MNKLTQLITVLSLLLVNTLSWAGEEIEIEFRLQPDGSGTKTRNQGIKVDDGEIEVYLDGREREVDSAKVDTDALFKMVAQSIREFEMAEGKRVRTPYTEVKMEYSSDDREIEVSRRYPKGEMPAELVKLQKRYLDLVWH